MVWLIEAFISNLRDISVNQSVLRAFSMQKSDKGFYNIHFKAVEIIHFTHTKRKPFESISKRGLKEGSHHNSRVYKSCCEPPSH